MRIAVLILTLALSGCAGFSSLMEDMNRREVTSCVHYQGSMRVAGGHVAISGVTATGGARLQECQDER